MWSVFETLKFLFFIPVAFMLLREVYVIFNLYSRYTKGMRLYYVPIIGYYWRMAFWKDRKDEWGWLKTIVAEMDKNNQKVLISNTILNTQP